MGCWSVTSSQSVRLRGGTRASSVGGGGACTRKLREGDELIGDIPISNGRDELGGVAASKSEESPSMPVEDQDFSTNPCVLWATSKMTITGYMPYTPGKIYITGMIADVP